MAVDANTYADHTKVEGRIGDLIKNREFTFDTTPSLTTVEETLDAVAAEMNAELQAAQYTAPIAEADDPIPHAWAVRANAAGAAGRLLADFPGAAMGDPQQNPLLNRRTSLLAEYERFLDIVREERLRSTKSEDRLQGFEVGSRIHDETGETNLPVFTRAMDDYPNAHTRSEP